MSISLLLVAPHCRCAQLRLSRTSVVPQSYLSCASVVPQLYLSRTSVVPQSCLSCASVVPQSLCRLYTNTVQELDSELEPPVRMEEEREVDLQVEEEEPEVMKQPEQPTPCLSEPNMQGIIRGSDLFGYVGIEAVLDQMRRKTMKAGFEFNIMVVVCNPSTSTSTSWDWIGHVLDEVLDVATSVFRHSHIRELVQMWWMPSLAQFRGEFPVDWDSCGYKVSSINNKVSECSGVGGSCGVGGGTGGVGDSWTGSKAEQNVVCWVATVQPDLLDFPQAAGPVDVLQVWKFAAYDGLGSPARGCGVVELYPFPVDLIFQHQYLTSIMFNQNLTAMFNIST
ncbi:hypothetical protein NFI96_002892 [Prochilodus magdalenae]|nr:hypothetical protein NFI96_002892 [Prochilodus magdalenae]